MLAHFHLKARLAPLSRFAALLAFCCMVAATAGEARDVIATHGAVTELVIAADSSQPDIVSAQEFAMPRPDAGTPARARSDLLKLLTNSRNSGSARSGFHPGGIGTGVESPETVGTMSTGNSGVSPQDQGTSGYPFSTSQADLNGVATNKDYPYRTTGKLTFAAGGGGEYCSASLIAPGIVVTAAHCVAGYGQSQYYNQWAFMPGYRNGVAPYGIWKVAHAYVLTAYYNGTDNCADYGITCPDDVAILVLSHKGASANPTYVGSKTGWLAWGYGGFGFAPNSIVQITQLGYPGDLDGATHMERNDSQGYVSASNSSNTIIGSLMTGGSSGGPWIVNFGTAPILTGGDAFGAFSEYNVLVGVTSWGFTDLTVKQMGAAPFTSANILALYNIACDLTPKACGP
jgi:V8-like Glu-specific endopeptidase